MKEKLLDMRDSAKAYWGNLTKTQKGIFIGSAIFILLIISIIIFMTLRTSYVPLYNDLSAQEVSQIKEELDAQDIPYEIEDGGTTITVPEKHADSLIVDLAGEGIPSSGNIDYSFFSENASWGITDNEFDVMKLDAMQTELANLIKGVEGIDDADVMINLPEESVFVSETDEEASASVVIHTDPGYEFEGNKIESLYHLVSKAVPNLPEENIVIRNQHLEYFDKESLGSSGYEDDYTQQQSIKNDIERDIQKRLQQMLGAIVGVDNVIVSVTSDIDFTQENRVEELVEPVDVDDMEGLPVSVETIHETYSGQGDVGGVPGTDDDDIAGYEADELEDEDGEYELIKETINNEFNRIQRDIVESPYKVRDLGIQVAVNRNVEDGSDIQQLTQQEMNSIEDSISSIIQSIINTSIQTDEAEVDEEINWDDNVSVVFQSFNGKMTPLEESAPTIPTWVYVVAGVLLLIIIALVVLLIRRRRDYEDVYVEDMDVSDEATEASDIVEDEAIEVDERQKQLEAMAKEKPEEFAKLLRSWIAND